MRARSVALTKRTSLRCCVPVDVVPIPAVHSHSTTGCLQHPGNTVASVLQAVPASGRTLRRQKGSQPAAETPAAAALVMLSADADNRHQQ